MKLLFFDIETTGLNFWQHGIHQLAGCIEIDGVVKAEFNYKIAPNPQAKIQAEALAVGNITLEQIQAYTPMEEVYKQFTTLLGTYVDKFDKKDKFYLIGFNNAAFDNPFLRAWFVQNGDQYFGSWFWSVPIDTFVLAGQHFLEKRPDMPDFKLQTVATSLGIVVDESMFHDALYDITITKEIYYRLKKIKDKEGFYLK